MDIALMARSFKSFNDFKAFLKDSGKDLELLVYPTLRFGAVFWIPDKDSGLGGEGVHPWVIISNYLPRDAVVTACLRTSSNLGQNIKKGLYQPAGVLAGLDREGVILTRIRRPFDVENFRDYRYEGLLPEKWLEELKQHLKPGG